MYAPRRLLNVPLLTVLAAISAVGCQPASSGSVVYRNDQLGFSFSLPASWRGYSIIIDQWQGMASGSQGDTVVQTGPLILIRHPLWTIEVPRQDIPIMAFTPSQWSAVQQGVFFVSAAGVGPTELGLYDRYVFALPPRYDYAFLPGWQEVETILQGNPLHTP